MRKLLIVLLSVFVITVTGCHSTDPPQTDTDTQLDTISETDIQNTETESVEPDISSDPSEDSISDIPGDSSVFTSSPDPGQTSTAESQSNSNQSAPPSQTQNQSQPVVVPDPLKPSSTPESKPQETNPPAEPVQSQKPSTQPGTNSSSTESGTQKTEPSTTDSPQTSTPPEKDMKAEYQRIISEVTAYAQSYSSKGFTFVWDDSLVFGWETGYMGTPRVKYEGVDGVISILKYHVDKIVNTVTDPSNGIPAVSANYKVMQVTVDGDIAFVVLYG